MSRARALFPQRGNGSPVNAAWTDRYPDPNRIRAEVRAMTDAHVEALTVRIPPDEIAGIYLKGSAHKPWDTPLDYVPEISDVDIHLWLRRTEDVERLLGTVEQGEKKRSMSRLSMALGSR